MTAQLLHIEMAERTLTRALPLPDGTALALAVTIRLETPGECCADIASTLAYSYDPPLPDDIAVRLDDRLYDGIYAGLAEAPGALPPGKLKVAITGLASEPPLATVLDGTDWPLIGAVAAALEELASAAFQAAWAELRPRWS
jgi:hypothetical protein